MLSDMVYATQFQALRVWLDGLTPEVLSVVSVLPGWTVADLIGHLVGVAGTIAVLQPASDETEPSTISAYLSGYAATAGQRWSTSRCSTLRRAAIPCWSA